MKKILALLLLLIQTAIGEPSVFTDPVTAPKEQPKEAVTDMETGVDALFSNGAQSSGVKLEHANIPSNLYIGEILGMLKLGESSSTNIASSFPSIKPFISFTTLAEKLYLNLTTQLKTVSFINDKEELICSIWRCFTLIHNMSLVLLQS